jgi:hypothetical protein
MEVTSITLRSLVPEEIGFGALQGCGGRGLRDPVIVLIQWNLKSMLYRTCCDENKVCSRGNLAAIMLTKMISRLVLPLV